ncbi:zinc finger protein 470-like [Cydia splendana]|uniref:zinc finger protein 470-like n=1 Tax=Cydia splendana TaxID=1100963 RepID=UPI0028F4B095
MIMCRTCLKTPAEKHISDLENGIKEGKHNCFEIMMFCLNIEVTQDSKITSKLCANCYKKILSFYKFKALSLKNDLYLRSLDPVVQLEDQKLSVYVDENGIKHENLLDSDEFGPVLLEDCDTEFKVDINVKSNNSDEDGEIDFKDNNSDEDGEIDFKDNNSYDDIEIDFKCDENISDNVEADEDQQSEQKVKHKNIVKDTKENAPKKLGHRKRDKSKKKEKWKPQRRVCEECGKSFLNLREHALQHQPKEGRQKLQCKACPKTFFSIGGRRKHYMVTHLGFKEKCDICGKEVAGLKHHKNLVHNPSALPYPCVRCERRFVGQSALDAHMVTHTKDLPFECDMCQNRFCSKNSVSRHIRQVHQKIRSHQCQFCSKAFFKIERLRAHVRSHTNERPHKCEECGKAFATAHYLKQHALIHGDKNFQCQHCDMSFAKSGNLRTHMVKHTKEKRYPCAFCGVRFGRSDHRRRHELTAHQKQRAAD